MSLLDDERAAERRYQAMRHRYGVKWPDGTETGPITDRYRLAARYAKSEGGKPWNYDRNREAGAESEGEETS